MDDSQLGSSFRDPSGFLFTRDGVLYRQVHHAYRQHFERLMDSGLCDQLTEAGLLVPHTDADPALALSAAAWRVIRPERIPFISYPYEWCFSQYRDAALTTLEIQRRALDAGLTLKDASAYNIQFRGCRPVLVDTLSFETYREGAPWIAYRQFCQHFLAPLALMAHRDARLGQLLRVYMDGVPLDLASALLPRRTYAQFGLLSHLHAHARTQRRYADRAAPASALRVSRVALAGIIDNLRGAIEGLKWRPGQTEWGDYYRATNYSAEGFEEKRALVSEFLDALRPASVWDLGGNIGVFSRLASERGAPTVCFDLDPAAVDACYREGAGRGEARLLPLVMDLTNPSGDIGWHHRERDSLLRRGPADAVLALALVHHLAISNNVPLDRLAAFFADAGRSLIIEWVPKSDSQVQRLLATREDIFPDYSQAGFEAAFAGRFRIERREPIRATERTLYLMRRRA
ncbi:MAG: SAM-dependent methyltransferase [Armatimonadetes bacterium]|nr:SAM-dependent methyltransferase [Armatimonadota bacterium]